MASDDFHVMGGLVASDDSHVMGGLVASDDSHVMGGLVASDDLGVPLDCILHQQRGWGGALMTAECFSDQVRTRRLMTSDDL